MSAIPHQLMTADEFLVWAEAQPREAGKFELWDGQIVMTRGPVDGPLHLQSERSQHWDAKGIIYRAFQDAIRRAKLPCHVVVDGASVRLPNANSNPSNTSKDRLVEPEVLVYCGPKVPRDVLIVPNPLIVVEVLSPSTTKYVTTDKLEGYMRHPSIQHYLIVDPDKPLIIHHQRGDQDWITRVGRTKILRFDPPGLEVDLSELFAPDA